MPGYLPPSGPIRTYKEFIQFFELMCSQHMAVKQFQVGELSDIDVESNVDNPTKYPLVFLVPQTSFMDRFGKLTLGFSMIVADIAKNQEDLEVNTHNNTMMIIQDLLSRIILTTPDKVDFEVETPVAVTPFVERFKNNLAGWTAEINIGLTSPFNFCDSAFD